MTEQQRQHLVRDLFRNEYHTMVGYVRKRIDDAAAHDSEDIVQDVFAAVFAATDVTAPVGNLLAYCYQGLRNRVIDMVRRRKKHESLDAPLDVVDGASQTLHDLIADARYDTGSVVEHRQVHRIIMESIDELPEAQRAVVIATEIENRSFSELAEMWNIPLGTLLARKSRAMEKIKTRLLARDIAPPELQK
jgi:RNA polymerase sigma factor (sigma-70 family)